jgi:hypothetical protein
MPELGTLPGRSTRQPMSVMSAATMRPGDASKNSLNVDDHRIDAR